MIAVSVQNHIRELLAQSVGQPITSMQLVPVGGGSINLAYELIVNDKDLFFCKINSVDKYPALFEKEKNGLQVLHTENVIRVPAVYLCTVRSDYQVLVMEWIEQGMKTDQFWQKFGEQLAALHYISSSAFGLFEDNYMGALLQSNHYTPGWVDFFILHRLMPQVQLAREKKLLEAAHVAQFDLLYKKLPDIFLPEPPALLHGDLWSGNYLCDEKNEPVLIDPAVYYGSRHMDLAMTTLFGGFEQSFYEAYHHHYPLPASYREQWDLCNLYPLLIHLNLFGKSYLADILHTIRRY